MTASPHELENAVVALVAAVVALVRGTAPAAEPEPWVDVATGAAYAACSEDTIRELIGSGVLPAGRIGVRGVRLRRSDIDRVLLAQAPPVADAGEGDKVVVRILASLSKANGDG